MNHKRGFFIVKHLCLLQVKIYTFGYHTALDHSIYLINNILCTYVCMYVYMYVRC